MHRARLSIAVLLLTFCRALAKCAAWVAPAAVAALLVPVEARAQGVPVDSRWRIMVELDTMIVGPLNDLRRFAGLRAAKNEEVRRCVWELHQQSRELALLRSALDLSRKSDKANAQLVGDLNEALVQCVDARARAERRAKRRSPFIWGISGLAAGSLATLFLVR
jgi:hypothetical protein